MTAYALQRKLGQVGITVSSVNPGFVSCFWLYLCHTMLNCLTFNSLFCRWKPILLLRLQLTTKLGPICTKLLYFFLHVGCQVMYFMFRDEVWFVDHFPAMTREPREGATTSINCAVNPDLNSQQCFYYDSCQVKESSADSRYMYTYVLVCTR